MKADNLRKKAKGRSSTIAKAAVVLKPCTGGHALTMVMILISSPDRYIMHSRHASGAWQASGRGGALCTLHVPDTNTAVTYMAEVTIFQYGVADA